MILLLGLLACKDDAPADLQLDTEPQVRHSQDSVLPSSGCVDGARGISPQACVNEAPCSWTGAESYGFFGMSVTAGSDLNADGVPDLAFGSPGASVLDGTGAQLNDAGSVTLVSGASLLSGTISNLGVWSGVEASTFHGSRVSMPGDVDGDTVPDLVAGALAASPGGLKFAGQLSISLGQEGAWGDTEAVLLSNSTWTGESEYARVGHMLTAAGDVNGDGLADLWATGELKRLVSDSETWSAGRVYLVLGRSSWPEQASLADADAALNGDTSNAGAGQSLAGDADFDGDGYRDVAIGASWSSGYKGSVFVVPGSAAGFSGSETLGTRGARINGAVVYDAMGYTLAAGDFNADGVDDLAVGVPLDDTRGDAAGKVVIYAGAADFYSGGASPLGSWVGEFDDFQLGTGLIAGGDLTGDGIEDLLVGSVNTYRGLVTKGGRLYVVPGATGGWSTDLPAEELETRVHGAGVKDYLGATAAIADFDADGVGDVVVTSGYANVAGVYDAGAAWLFWGA